MKCLTFAHFLDMMEKTHCPYYHIAKNNDGFYTAYLGFALDSETFFAVWKSRLFKRPIMNTKLVVTANAFHLTLYPFPFNIVFV